MVGTHCEGGRLPQCLQGPAGPVSELAAQIQLSLFGLAEQTASLCGHTEPQQHQPSPHTVSAGTKGTGVGDHSYLHVSPALTHLIGRNSVGDEQQEDGGRQVDDGDVGRRGRPVGER